MSIHTHKPWYPRSTHSLFVRLLAHALPLLLAVATLADARPVAPPVMGTPYGYPGMPSVASDGFSFLVVWHDYKGAISENEGAASVLAARITPDGQAAAPIVLALHTPAEPGPMAIPLVTWTGSHYLVAWYEAGLKRLVTMRIDREGQRIDTQARDTGINLVPAGMASADGRVLVGGSASIVLFDGDGMPLAAPVTVSDGFLLKSLVSNGRGFLITGEIWRGYAGTETYHYASVSTGGVLAPLHAVDNAAISPVAAANGPDYLISVRQRPAAPFDRAGVLNFRIDESGNAHPGKVIVDQLFSPAYLGPVRYQSGYLYPTRGDGSSVNLVPLDRDGGLLIGTNGGPSFQPYDPGIGQIPDAPNSVLATNVLATLIVHIGSNHAPNAHVVNTDHDVLLQAGPHAQTPLALAPSPSGWLAVWSELHDGLSDIRAGRVDAAGNLLDGAGILIEKDLTSAVAQAAFDGRDYVVVWQTATRSLRISTIGADGTYRDSQIFDPVQTFTPFAASAPGRALIVWVSSPQGAATATHCVVIGPDGVPSSPVLILNDAATPLSAAWSQDRWLFGFRAPSTPNALLGVTISGAGKLLDTPHPLGGADPSLSERSISLAANDSGFAATWWTTSSGGKTPTVWARNIPRSGPMGEAIQIGSGSAPSVAWMGNDYLIAWQNGNTLWSTTLAHPANIRPLTGSGELEANIQLVSSPAGLAAFFNRSVAAWPYLSTPAAFIEVLPPIRRRATAR